MQDRDSRARHLLVAALVLLAAREAQAQQAVAYPWPVTAADGTVESRIQAPPGFARRPAPPDSFAAWLRGLPVKSGRPAVRLFNGQLKANQEAHHAVLDIDVGKRDRQQCADAVIRLRAEFLHRAGRDSEICFRFTNGTPARWTEWKSGMRPNLSTRKTPWEKTAAPDAGYPSFRRYLDTVFSYAGTFSLHRELDKVADPRAVEAGDVFI
jgi:hypothetical protein